jgi:hypothetical protein
VSEASFSVLQEFSTDTDYRYNWDKALLARGHSLYLEGTEAAAHLYLLQSSNWIMIGGA